jgi:hypothetical protein
MGQFGLRHLYAVLVTYQSSHLNRDLLKCTDEHHSKARKLLCCLTVQLKLQLNRRFEVREMGYGLHHIIAGIGSAYFPGLIWV